MKRTRNLLSSLARKRSREESSSEEEISEGEVEEMTDLRKCVSKSKSAGNPKRRENDCGSELKTREKPKRGGNGGGPKFIGGSFSLEEARRRWPHRYKVTILVSVELFSDISFLIVFLGFRDVRVPKRRKKLERNATTARHWSITALMSYMIMF